MRITRIIILTLAVMLATPAFPANFSAINIGDLFYINRVGPNNDTVTAQAALPEYQHASYSHNEYKLRPDAYQLGRKTEFTSKMRLENGKIIKDSQMTQGRVTMSGYFIREVEIINLSSGQPSVIKQTFLITQYKDFHN